MIASTLTEYSFMYLIIASLILKKKNEIKFQCIYLLLLNKWMMRRMQMFFGGRCSYKRVITPRITLFFM